MIEIKELVGLINPKEVLGRLDTAVQQIDSIESAKSGSLTFCVGDLRNSNASVIICSNGTPKPNQTLLIVDNPRLSFIRAATKFFPPDEQPDIHPTAIINWPYVEIGKNVKIGPGCTIGFDGFGYERNEDGRYEKFPHYGRVIIEDDVEIQANVNIDRGTLGDTIIGEGTKIDSLVHIAHNAEIGKNCIIVCLSCIAGSDKIGDNSWIAPGAIIRDGITVGKGSVVGMGAIVTKDVEDNVTVIGNPARKMEK